MGLNAALATTGRALEVFSTGIQVVGQNIANAQSPDYIREKLIVGTNDPYKQNNLLVGTGVQTRGIRQQIDRFLEKRIHSANSEAEGTEARNSIYKILESSVGELGENDLSTKFNSLLAAIQDVANQPESVALREVVILEGSETARAIEALRFQVDEIRQAQEIRITDLVNETNQLIDQVAALNTRILDLESAQLLESEAGGLRSQRYAAINRLAEILPIRTVYQDNGFTDIFIGSDYLVIAGKVVQHLETETTVDRGIQVTNVKVENTNSPIATSGGVIGGVLNGRDEILGSFVDQLDEFSRALIFEFNKLHSSGEGHLGYEDITGSYEIEDTTAALNQAGLSFTPEDGEFEFKVIDKSTGIASTQVIQIDLDGIGGDDTSLDDLVTTLNTIDHVSASVTADGRLRITALNNHELRFGNDTSHLLAALGINTFFQGTDSETIELNSQIASDGRFFAAGKGGGEADSSNAVLLSKLNDQSSTILSGLSIDEYYDSLVSGIAQASASEQALSEGYDTFRDSLFSQRAQFSGVSLDEEVIQLLGFQRSYQTAARFISAIDELFDTLVNI